MPAALIWLIAARVVVGGAGALPAPGSHWLFGWPVWADGLMFVIVAFMLLVGVRPMLRRRLVAGRGLPEPMKALEGKTALVLDRVARHEGQVKLDGQVWTARPLNDDDIYQPGDHVIVVHIDGATAVVSKIV